LETLTAGLDGDEQKYEATTPGFSFFAVSAEEKVSEETTTIIDENGEVVEEGLEST